MFVILAESLSNFDRCFELQRILSSITILIPVVRLVAEFKRTTTIRHGKNSQVSAEPSPADEQQQISADSAGRLRRNLVIRKNEKFDLTLVEIYRLARIFLV